MKERSAHGKAADRAKAYEHLPAPIAPEDMSTAEAADPPPPLPNSDYDKQERMLRDAGG